MWSWPTVPEAAFGRAHCSTTVRTQATWTPATVASCADTRSDSGSPSGTPTICGGDRLLRSISTRRFCACSICAARNRGRSWASPQPSRPRVRPSQAQRPITLPCVPQQMRRSSRTLHCGWTIRPRRNGRPRRSSCRILQRAQRSTPCRSCTPCATYHCRRGTATWSSSAAQS